MATSFIQFYKLDNLQIEKNFIIEDFYRFLDEYDPVFILRDFQYLKINLTMTIKVNFNQEYLSMTSDKDCNYCVVKNSDDSRLYYFYITNKTWKSQNTIEMNLSLDTLNTFKWDEDYIVDKKTLVLREHKDRVKLLEGSTISRPSFSRVIDLRSEGINPPLYKMREQDIVDKADTSWSLMYKNRENISPTDYNQVNPVDCYLMPNENTGVYYNQTGKILNAVDILTTGSEYWFFNIYYKNNENLGFELPDGKKIYVSHGERDPQTNLITVSLKKNGNQIEVRKVKYFTNVQLETEHKTLEIYFVDYVKVLNSPDKISYLYCPNSLPSDYREIYGLDSPWEIRELDFGSLQTRSYIDDSFIDRTDSRIVKIINLPYCPTSYNVVDIAGDDFISFSPIWEIDTTNKTLKLTDNDAPFKNEILMPSSLNPFDIMVIDYTSESTELPKDTNTRRDYMESKIFHSDFYQPKFVYDSFSLVFRSECLDFNKYWESRDVNDEYDGLGFEMSFIMSRNIVSKFLFMFPRYFTTYGSQDYDNVVAVGRNNEEVLYTSQYINYLRTGYNYDLKSKERSAISGGLGLGGSVLGTIIGLLGSIATQNYVGAVASAVVGTMAITTSSVSYAQSLAQSEQSLEQKLENAKMQSVSVQNADDIDLLNAYSRNRAKMCFYEVSPTMKKALLDMFYYCGYSTQEQKIPNINSRIWFNFLQCELVINESSNIPSMIIDDIKARFKEGVSIFHNRNDRWDIEQKLENYESWLF